MIWDGSGRAWAPVRIFFLSVSLEPDREAGHNAGELLNIGASAWMSEIDGGSAITAADRVARLQNGDFCDSLLTAFLAGDGRVDQPIDLVDVPDPFHFVRH
jgi:hypothetical protein